MNKIILHIPHSGTKIPFFFWKHTVLDKKNIIKFKMAITDTDTDKLFGQNNEYEKIVFKYSRIFCDVEKFADDSKEIMSKFGMGVVYTKTNEGDVFLKASSAYKSFVMKHFYWKYHKRLDKIAKKHLNEKVVFVDCHSFSREIIMFDDKKQDLPDICIGCNKGYNKKLIQFVCKFLENNNYAVKINYPYEGSMVPNCLLKNPNKNFCSFMIEVNKNLYLNDEGFNKLHTVLNNLFQQIEKQNVT